jgi:transcriptional regulator with XRE-family HTH domain
MRQQNVTYLHVGEYLSRLMEERQVTTEQLAKATGLSQNLIMCLIAG